MNQTKILFTIFLLLFSSCLSSYNSVKEFVMELDGKNVYRFTLQNKSGAKLILTNYGATITELWMPDKKGNFDNVVLGFTDVTKYRDTTYLNENLYLGATIGRYANRIKDANFVLDKQRYALTKNAGLNHTHGGKKGFDKSVWDWALDEQNNKVEFKYKSGHLEEGYPGNVDVAVHFKLTDDNQVEIEYFASTDQRTHLNLTNHSYFNLNSSNHLSITKHFLELNCDRYLPVDRTLVPLGEINEVNDTPFDFREIKEIGAEINLDHQQLKLARGYDHCWVKNDVDQGTFSKIGTLIETMSGRKMDILTTEPSLQFYSGNFLKGNMGDQDRLFDFRSGLCLETGHFPDSPNQSHFPSTILNSDDRFYSKTVYQFSVIQNGVN
ncbi:aldose epimerase family protein [Sediminitomix flava]|uniref:Aldose 1-epimerase n=1 Tax=Sediminitomix flava TaxID=379075 RepID=A0A315Z578_SEDFL|nr:aldose epimerase family protein [Sediminitomix flava]PWJ37975.1 aldose 1-epimerase [Sediminitomix flava]